MRKLASELSDTVGNAVDLARVAERSAAQNESHQVMLSEEEEEDEDDTSSNDLRHSEVPTPKIVGNHLTNDASSVEAPKTQVFSGSSDEWTDQRIKEF